MQSDSAVPIPAPPSPRAAVHKLMKGQLHAIFEKKSFLCVLVTSSQTDQGPDHIPILLIWKNAPHAKHGSTG